MEYIGMLQQVFQNIPCDPDSLSDSDAIWLASITKQVLHHQGPSFRPTTTRPHLRPRRRDIVTEYWKGRLHGIGPGSATPWHFDVHVPVENLDVIKAILIPSEASWSELVKLNKGAPTKHQIREEWIEEHRQEVDFGFRLAQNVMAKFNGVIGPIRKCLEQITRYKLGFSTEGRKARH